MGKIQERKMGEQELTVQIDLLIVHPNLLIVQVAMHKFTNSMLYASLHLVMKFFSFFFFLFCRETLLTYPRLP